MNKTITAIAQANLDHYNNHLTAHAAITVVAGVAAYVVIRRAARKIAVPGNKIHVIHSM